MNSFALYRLPNANTFTKIVSERPPLVINDAEDIGKQKCFIIAPFHSDKDTPMVLILPDTVEVLPVDSQAKTASPNDSAKPLADSSRKQDNDEEIIPPDDEYQKAFTLFKALTSTRHFQKLVLARSKDVKFEKDPIELFRELCQRYPRLTIMLFSTPLTGNWIIATPEILLEEKDGACRTIALAGTMPYNEDNAEWSDKNKLEQHIVEQYIENVLTSFADQVIKKGPYTSRAGNLQHLRTDFCFMPKEGSSIGKIISRLHPTPAVCGYPKDKAKEIILRIEKLDRKYYSGFAGPIGINDETHLYVSLRCAQLHDGTATLYAGGGILADSGCCNEWEETEAKMRTIEDVL